MSDKEPYGKNDGEQWVLSHVQSLRDAGLTITEVADALRSGGFLPKRIQELRDYGASPATIAAELHDAGMLPNYDASEYSHLAGQPTVSAEAEILALLDDAKSNIKVVAYMRTSTKSQRFDLQRYAIDEWAKARGCAKVHFFSDAAKSGALPIAKRPGLSAALDAMAPYGVLLAYARDRLARDVEIGAEIDDIVGDFCGSVITIADPVEVDDILPLASMLAARLMAHGNTADAETLSAMIDGAKSDK